MSYEKVEDIATKLKNNVKNVVFCGALGAGAILLGHSMSATGKDEITMDVVEAAAGLALGGVGIGAKRGFGKTLNDTKMFIKQVGADEDVLNRAINIKNIRDMKAKQI